MDKNELWHRIQEQIDTIKRESDSLHHPVLEKALNALQHTLENFMQEQIIMGLPHPHPRSRVYRSEPKEWQIKDCDSNVVFENIVTLATHSKKPTACIFDLDGTLFDVGHRTLGILNEWLQSETAKKFDKNLRKKITKLDYSHIGYSLSHAFENSGFDLRNQETMSFFSSVERFWKKKFFDGETLLKYDKVMKNAKDFLVGLYEKDIAIFYLTGRNRYSMHEGTIEQLKKFEFPYEKNKLILKSNPHLDDQIFKAEQVRNIKQNYNVVGNFENEYLNLAYMYLEAKDAVQVIVDSQHSGRVAPTVDVPVYRFSQFSDLNCGF